MLNIVEGNLLDVKKGVIVHQVNCRKTMGGGVALQIRNKYPSHYRDYVNTDPVLGELIITNVDSLTIIGMYSQFNYGNCKHIVYTRYDAFESCLIKIKHLKELNPSLDFYMPYNIGCDRGNGDWSIISSMIEEICPFIILIKYNK